MSSNHLFCRSMPNSSSLVVKLRPPSMLALPPSFLLPCRPRQTQSRSKRGELASTTRSFTSAEQLRASFVNALVRAGHDGSCKERERRRRGKKTEQITQRRLSSTMLTVERENNEVARRPKPRPRTGYTREDVLGLVDQYDDWPGVEQPQLGSGKAEDTWEKHLSWSEGQAKRSDVYEGDEEKLDAAVTNLHTLLIDDSSTPEAVFEAYKELPKPGAKYLDKGQRIYLIRKLSVMEEKTSARTLAFLSLLDDYRTAKLPIPKHAWNSAIHLGSTTLSKFTDTEVEFAIKTWKEMEIQAGVQGDLVTFNILFNVVSKAGKVALAELILQEMDARHLSWTRYTHVGAILYYGIRQQGEEVRAHYRDMVSSGEVVDTLVLNCVIGALMNAGEHDAAYAVYTRMKTLAKEREGTTYAPRLWSKQREIGHNLVWISNEMRKARKSGDDSRIRQTERLMAGMQDMISLAPDQRTFDILLRHYCRLGEFHKVLRVLEDMQESGCEYKKETFTSLFRAFAEHGCIRYTTWTASRFASTWAACEALLLSSRDTKVPFRNKEPKRLGEEKPSGVQDDDWAEESEQPKDKEKDQSADNDNPQLRLNDASSHMGIWALVAARRLEGDGGPNASHVYGVLCQAWEGDRPVEEVFIDPDGPVPGQAEDETITWLDDTEPGEDDESQGETPDEDWEESDDDERHGR